MVKIVYKPGDKVFAKVKGYPPWPARVEGDTGKRKYNVLFYGTQETGAIKPEDLSYYLKYKDSYVHKYMKRVGYEEAVKQIEEAVKKDGGDGNDGASGDDSTHDIEISDASSTVSTTSEKKGAKRKVTSLPLDEPKRTPTRGRRKSVATSESKEDSSEEPASKKPRRRSNVVTESKEEEDISEKTTKSSDNGLKDTVVEISTDEAEEVNESEEADLAKSDAEVTKSDAEVTKSDAEVTKSDAEVTKSEAEVTKSDAEVTKSDAEPQQSLPEDTTSASETERMEKSNVQKETDKPMLKGKSLPKKKVVVDASEKTKEPEFVEIKNNPDASMSMEEGETSDEPEKSATEKIPVIVEIVTEQLLNNNILYAEHVKKHLDLYNERPVEARHSSKDEVFAVKLPSGTICGVKLHKDWPLTHDNEHDRALYDEKVAKLTLEVKDQLSSGKKTPREVDVEVVPDIQMTLEDLKEMSYARDIESKRKRLDRLKKEADLVTWDSKIKNNLGLDKALPDAALEALKEFKLLQKNLDALMFKKHPHVLDTVRRLRKYVGNTKEWDMSNKDIETFTKKAEKIRNEAEKIYNAIKSVVEVKEEKGTFWDSFKDVVGDFRTKCKDLTEAEVLFLCAEPDSRQAFLDKMDEVTESEGTSINPTNTSEPVLKDTSVQGWSEKK